MAKKPPGTSVEKIENKNTVRELMTQMKGSFADVLPKHLTPERVLKMALVAVSRQPKLLECTKESFARSVMQSAELGLDCSGTLGSAYLVPYWSSKLRAFEAQFIPGYRGLIDLARRSGQVSRIEAQLVHENDEYELTQGTEPVLVHKPKLDGPRGKVVFAYMVAELTDGSKQVESMTVDDLDKIKARSKSRDRDGNIVGPWVTDEGEMQRKTVVRRGVKYLPLSPERAVDLGKALAFDQDLLDVDVTKTLTSDERLKELDERLERKEPAADGPSTGTDDQPGESQDDPDDDEFEKYLKEKQGKLWSLCEQISGGKVVDTDKVLHEFAGTVKLDTVAGEILDKAIAAAEARLEKPKGKGKKTGELF